MSESQQRETGLGSLKTKTQKIGIGSMVISFMLEIIVITQLYLMDDMLIMVAIGSEQFLDIRSIGDSIQMTTRTDCREETLRRFVERNTNNVNVYIRTYKVQNAYLIVDPESYQCLIIYHGGEKDYFL
ncbi:hypothetical protein RhiirA4_459542 [Rhizophagus irregularis]|uniref:Uncharacterized protein n=1 Tax=Rhizophagus irregularis TaxID=588596 RepID=A0A2I1GEM8_9GLOM|nr:hypothetical protein RhiirA4_459542 [Rhizophagus irregularis]